MAIIKCKMCGGDLELIPGQSVAECEYCGSRQTVPAADNDKKMTLFARANRLRAACEFDKAAGIYETIVADFPEEAEAYWGLVLCKYGIEYVDDPATGKKIPTCHRSSFDSVLEDTNLDQVLENADVIAQKVYREEAKQFERIRKGILEVSSTEKPYDIFICYKETDEKGDRTLDSVLAQDLYTALTDKGYRVFFSRVTLRGKLGEAFEPYIFAALNSAKVMLAVGTCYEYYNAVWVKNEWSRYLKICETDKSRHLIPCYKDLEPEDMPREFSHLQGADLGKMGAIQDILFNMEKYIPLQKQTVIQEKVVVGGAGGNKIASLLDRGNMALEDGDWNKAMSFFEDVLNNDSKNAQAYLGETLAQEKCRTMDAFARKRKEATLAVTGETLKLEPNTAHVAEMVEKYQIPGYCESHAIRSLYDFDLSYHSDVAERKAQYHAEERYWDNHKQLSRAEKFATGEVAKTLQQEKQALFAALKERITKAEQAEAETVTQLKEAYATHIRQADEQAEALYQNAAAKRERDYQTLVEQAKQESSIKELLTLTRQFEKLNGYRDSDAMAAYCKERREDEMAKMSAERAQKAEIARKEAERIAKRNKRIAIICSTIAAVTLASFILITQSIHSNKYRSAVTLMESGQYEEAIAVFESLNGYKDTITQIQNCNYEFAVELMNAGQCEDAIAIFDASHGFETGSNVAKYANANLLLISAIHMNASREVLLENANISLDELTEEEIAITPDYASMLKVLQSMEKSGEKISKEHAIALEQCGELTFNNNQLEFELLYEMYTNDIEPLPQVKLELSEDLLLSKCCFDGAKSLFEELGNYRDSESLAASIPDAWQALLESQYQIGEELFATGDYDAAQEKFQSVGNYHDSADKALLARNYAAYTIAQQEQAQGHTKRASEIYQMLGDFMDSAEQISTIWNKNWSLKRVGMSVNFGSYQGESISWYILDMQDNRALLISNYVLDAQFFDTQNVAWADSDIRQWLNSTFIDTAFNKTEQERILSTTLEGNVIMKDGSIGGESTEDCIFLLSKDEIEKYSTAIAGKWYTSATKYARSRELYYQQSTGYCMWWLRTTDNRPYYSNNISVDYDGDLRWSHGHPTDYNNKGYHSGGVGVRPVLWVSFE